MKKLIFILLLFFISCKKTTVNNNCTILKGEVKSVIIKDTLKVDSTYIIYPNTILFSGCESLLSTTLKINEFQVNINSEVCVSEGLCFDAIRKDSNQIKLMFEFVGDYDIYLNNETKPYKSIKVE